MPFKDLGPGHRTRRMHIWTNCCSNTAGRARLQDEPVCTLQGHLTVEALWMTLQKMGMCFSHLIPTLINNRHSVLHPKSLYLSSHIMQNSLYQYLLTVICELARNEKSLSFTSSGCSTLQKVCAKTRSSGNQREAVNRGLNALFSGGSREVYG